jgi:hypothetical protein
MIMIDYSTIHIIILLLLLLLILLVPVTPGYIHTGTFAAHLAIKSARGQS